MTRRDWWYGVALIVVALWLHASARRYDFIQLQHRYNGVVGLRVDHWTGNARRVIIGPDGWQAH